MNARKSVLLLCAVVLSVSGAAFAALKHENIGITKVDVVSPDRVIIHIDEAINGGYCVGNTQLIACDLDDKYCEPAMRIALASQLSGRKISFDVAGECLGSAAKFTRLRNNNL